MALMFREEEFPFKRCTLCSTVWKTKDEFLQDPNVRLNGYQKTSQNVRTIASGGLLIFTHHRKECGTTLAIYGHCFKEKNTKEIPIGH